MRHDKRCDFQHHSATAIAHNLGSSSYDLLDASYIFLFGFDEIPLAPF